jgi:hypothetical protein
VSFGRKEGLEDLLASVGVYADAGIRNCNREPFSPVGPVRSAPATQKQPAARTLHGLDGVRNQVTENLPNFAFNAPYQVVKASLLLDSYTAVQQPALIDIDHIVN